MGYFRRYKLTDYTADRCKCAMDRISKGALLCQAPGEVEMFMDQWACYRELLARHEGENQPPDPSIRDRMHRLRGAMTDLGFETDASDPFFQAYPGFQIPLGGEGCFSVHSSRSAIRTGTRVTITMGLEEDQRIAFSTTTED